MEEENVAEVLSSDNIPPVDVLEEPMEPPKGAMKPPPPTPTPRTVRIRKPRMPSSSSQQVVVPEINDQFWAKLLQTQRSAEHATRLQRLSEFNLL